MKLNRRIVVSAACVVPEAWVPDGFGGRMLRKAQQVGLFGKSEVKEHLSANPGGHGTHVVHEYQRSTGHTEEVAVRDAVRELDTEQARIHAEALAGAIREAGGPDRTKAWFKEGVGARVYLPGNAGYLSVGQDGSVKETDRGHQCFAASALHGNWRKAVEKGRKAYGKKLGLRLEQYADERELRATGARLQHREALTDEAFDAEVLRHAPRHDDAVQLGGDRMKAMFPDEATAGRMVAYATRMLSLALDKPEEEIRGWIEESAAGIQIKLAPHAKLGSAAVDEIENQAMQFRQRTPDAYGARHRMFGYVAASELAEVAMQRAIHGRSVLPMEPIASKESRVEYLRKGRPALILLRKADVARVIRPDLGSIQRDAMGRPTFALFSVGEFKFKFQKSAKGMPILSVTGPKLQLPYHMVVKNHADAMQRAPDVAATFEAGGCPMEGVFRSEDDTAVSVKYPGRTKA